MINFILFESKHFLMYPKRKKTFSEIKYLKLRLNCTTWLLIYKIFILSLMCSSQYNLISNNKTIIKMTLFDNVNNEDKWVKVILCGYLKIIWQFIDNVTTNFNKDAFLLIIYIDGSRTIMVHQFSCKSQRACLWCTL